MSDFEPQILFALNERAGLTTGQIARLVAPMFGHNMHTHSAQVRRILLLLESRGLVKRMDDLKPVCWLKAKEAGNV